MNGLNNFKNHNSICLKGAIFTLQDIEPSKMLIALCELFCKNADEKMPDNLKKSISNNDFNSDTLYEIIGILDNELDFTDYSIEDHFTSYSDFIDILLEEDDLLIEMTEELWKWSFDENNYTIGTQEVVVYLCCNLKGTFVYDYNENIIETITNDERYDHYMFMINEPPADCKANNSRGEILCHIQETAKILLKDDIDWDNRLGTFTGKIVED